MILINESKENNSEAAAANEKECMVMFDVWASIWFVEHIQIQKQIWYLPHENVCADDNVPCLKIY